MSQRSHTASAWLARCASCLLGSAAIAHCDTGPELSSYRTSGSGGTQGGSVGSGGAAGVAGSAGSAGMGGSAGNGGTGQGGDAGDGGTGVEPLVVQNHERGPGPNSVSGEAGAAGAAGDLSWNCTQAPFESVKPIPGSPHCDWPGLTPSSCRTELFCEGCENSGICLDYLTAERNPDAGDYALRIHYQLKARENSRACELLNNQPDGFSGVLFWLGNRADAKCGGDHPPVDFSPYNVLSVWVRGEGDAEVALQESFMGRETNRLFMAPKGPKGKYLLSENPAYEQFSKDVWTEVRIPVSELLRTTRTVMGDGGMEEVEDMLDRRAIVAVVIVFARGHFEDAGTYEAGMGSEDVRWLDIGDIKALPRP
jgi:hypothetical protein